MGTVNYEVIRNKQILVNCVIINKLLYRVPSGSNGRNASPIFFQQLSYVTVTKATQVSIVIL